MFVGCTVIVVFLFTLLKSAGEVRAEIENSHAKHVPPPRKKKQIGRGAFLINKLGSSTPYYINFVTKLRFSSKSKSKLGLV